MTPALGAAYSTSIAPGAAQGSDCRPCFCGDRLGSLYPLACGIELRFKYRRQRSFSIARSVISWRCSANAHSRCALAVASSWAMKSRIARCSTGGSVSGCVTYRS